MSDLRAKRPRLLEARIAGLRLSAEERLVMARIDGRLSVDELASATGIDGERIERIVSKLAFDGALDLAEDRPAAPSGVDTEGTTSLADFAAALGMDPTAFGGAKAPPAAAAPPPPPPPPEPPAEPEAVGLESVGKLVAAQVAEAEAETPEERAEREQAEADDQSVELNERNYREIYATHWKDRPVATRADFAHRVGDPHLLALCFDPDPRVIAAVLDNTRTGFDHARLIALYHRTTTGLEVLSRRREWIKDGLVERRLLRNPMIGDVVLGRILASKRLLATYKIAVDREVPELTRSKSRTQLRQKWTGAPPEDRAELVLRTEARCLLLMSGCTFDSRTTAILCGKPVLSAMFVQSVAKFAASPPALLAHLAKQPFVRKNAALRKMLMVHPNMPSDAKR